MADIENRLPDNVDGAYYVDDNCIACGVCPDEAPENFKMSEDGSNALVYKQPETAEEKEDCRAALESCPVDAIGDDG